MQKICKISISCVTLFFGNYSYTSINQNSLYLPVRDSYLSQLAKLNNDNFNKNQPIGNSFKGNEGEDSVSELGEGPTEEFEGVDLCSLADAAEDYFDNEENMEDKYEEGEGDAPSSDVNSLEKYHRHEVNRNGVSELGAGYVWGSQEGDLCSLADAAEDYVTDVDESAYQEEVPERAKRGYESLNPERHFPEFSTNPLGWHYEGGDLFPVKRNKISKPNIVAEIEPRVENRLPLVNASRDYIFNSGEYGSFNLEEMGDERGEVTGSTSDTGVSSIAKRRKISQSYKESDKKHDVVRSSSDLSAFRNTNFKNYITQSIVTTMEAGDGSKYKKTKKIRRYLSYFLFHDSFNNIGRNEIGRNEKYKNLNKYLGPLKERLEELEVAIDSGLNNETQEKELDWYSILENQYKKIDEGFFNTFKRKEELLLDANIKAFLDLFVRFCENIINSLGKIISDLPNRSKVSVYPYWIRDFDELKRRLALYDNINTDIDSVCNNMCSADMYDIHNSPIKMEVINAFYEIYINSMQDFKNFLAAKGYYAISIPDNLIQEFTNYPQSSSFLCLYHSSGNIYKFLYCCANHSWTIVKDFLSQYLEDFHEILNKVNNDPINIRFLFEDFNVSYKALRRYIKLSISSGYAIKEAVNNIINRHVNGV